MIKTYIRPKLGQNCLISSDTQFLNLFPKVFHLKYTKEAE